MENKRLRKKLNTWFWWFLTILPIICFLIGLVSCCKYFACDFFQNGNINVEDYFDYVFNTSDVLNYSFNWAYNLSIRSVCDMFYNLFSLIGIGSTSTIDTLVGLFSWVVSIQLYHFIIDVIIFIFDWLHDFFERG